MCWLPRLTSLPASFHDHKRTCSFLVLELKRTQLITFQSSFIRHTVNLLQILTQNKVDGHQLANQRGRVCGHGRGHGQATRAEYAYVDEVITVTMDARINAVMDARMNAVVDARINAAKDARINEVINEVMDVAVTNCMYALMYAVVPQGRKEFVRE